MSLSEASSLVDSSTLMVFGPLFLIIALLAIATGSGGGLRGRLLRSIFGSSTDEDAPARPLKTPPSPPTAPMVGHLHHLSKYGTNPWEGFDALRATYGNIVSLQLGVWRSVLVSCPDIMREVLLTKGEIFSNRPNFERYSLIFGGDRENLATKAVIPRHGTMNFRRLNASICGEVATLTAHLQPLICGSSLVLAKARLMTHCAEIFNVFLVGGRFASYNKHLASETREFDFDEIVHHYDFIFYDINQCYSTDFLPLLYTAGINRKYLKEVSASCQAIRNWVEKEVLIPRVEQVAARRRRQPTAAASSVPAANSSASGSRGEAEVKVQKRQAGSGGETKDEASSSTSTSTSSFSSPASGPNEQNVTLKHDNRRDDLPPGMSEPTEPVETNKAEEEEKEKDRDFLDYLVKAHLDSPAKLSWPVTLFELGDLLGGSSAVGNLLMRLLGFVALDSKIADRMYREAAAAIRRGPTDADLDIDHEEAGEAMVSLAHRGQLPFTEAAVLETLRFASSPIVPHVATQDTTLAEYDISAGTMVLFNSFHLNMDPSRWTDPETFDPARFLVPVDGHKPAGDEDDDSQLMNYSISKPEHFFPFSSGRRSCLGYKMVQTIALLTTANLMLRYSIAHVDEEKGREQLKPRGTLALPVGDQCFSLKLTPRN